MMTIVGTIFTVMALLFFGTLIAGGRLYASMETHERQLMGVLGLAEVS